MCAVPAVPAYKCPRPVQSPPLLLLLLLLLLRFKLTSPGVYSNRINRLLWRSYLCLSPLRILVFQARSI